MKKVISILILFALISVGAFAIDFSGGGGLMLELTGNKADDGRLRVFNYGGFVFLDAEYAELDVTFSYGSITTWDEDGAKSEDAGNVVQLGFSLMGKLPINVAFITVFPLLGINYSVILDFDDDDVTVDLGDYIVEWLSQFGVVAGAGVDLSLSRQLYLRSSILFNLRFPDGFFKGLSDSVSDIKTTLGVGSRLQVGVGYRF